MKRNLLFTAIFLLCTIHSYSNYTTPGTGVRWNMNDLVANAGGDVTLSGSAYEVNDTIFISLLDTLYITSNITVRFAEGTYFDINGVLLINPPDSVLFTKKDGANGFLGMRIDSSNETSIRKLVFEYANSLRIFDCSPLIDSCTFRFNSPLTSFGNAAISLFRSKATISNCLFINNQRAAIQGGSNIANAPLITRCTFIGNNTLNGNVPQINLGTSGADTTKITHNQILRASTNSGGLGFLPLGTLNVVVYNNIIKNNRYGMTFNGGSNIYAMITYNQVDSNNTQNDPNLGGSGISFTGGSSTSHQKSTVTGNLFRWNLWGVTIQNGAQPNLGNLTNADTADNGKNFFIDNTNGNTPFIDLYNNSPDDIWAQGNYWNTNDQNAIEAKIFHKPDNASLGLVIYNDFIVPVQLTHFKATVQQKDVRLEWETLSEINSQLFEIERARNAFVFEKIGAVTAAGSSVQQMKYSFKDVNILSDGGIIYYRLKQLDKDGRHTYSKIITVKNLVSKDHFIKVYPNVNVAFSLVFAEITVETAQNVRIHYISGDGKTVAIKNISLAGGFNRLALDAGILGQQNVAFIRFEGKNFVEVRKMIN